MSTARRPQISAAARSPRRRATDPEPDSGTGMRCWQCSSQEFTLGGGYLWICSACGEPQEPADHG